MAAKIIYERFLWFHNQVKSEKYPNSRNLAEKFELSQKTAQRDIEFIRDRLRAPLVYVAHKRGYAYYAYEEKAYELPGIWINCPFSCRSPCGSVDWRVKGDILLIYIGSSPQAWDEPVKIIMAR